MLRVGLTGELGSGKSTVARLLAEHGAIVLSSDDMGRAMMQPGQPVFDAIVSHLGTAILTTAGTLDRPALAALAFDPVRPRIEELNEIIHPAVLAAQERRIATLAHSQPDSIVVVESALLFTTRHVGGEEPWRKRFDRIILVTAPDDVKIKRFLHRTAGTRSLSPTERDTLIADAERRLAAQRIAPDLAGQCIEIENNGTPAALATRTEEVFRQLRAVADDVQARASSQ